MKKVLKKEEIQSELDKIFTVNCIDYKIYNEENCIEIGRIFIIEILGFEKNFEDFDDEDYEKMEDYLIQKLVKDYGIDKDTIDLSYWDDDYLAIYGYKRFENYSEPYSLRAELKQIKFFDLSIYDKETYILLANLNAIRNFEKKILNGGKND